MIRISRFDTDCVFCGPCEDFGFLSCRCDMLDLFPDVFDVPDDEV
jgi:hypothetical protein